MRKNATLRSDTRRLAFAGALALAMLSVAAPASAGGRSGADYIPNVEVVDQNGRKLKFYDDVMRGRIVVVSFIYTTCKDICGLLTARVGLLYEQLGDAAGRDVHFVSVSIDPQTDTPARLKEHAEAFGAGPGWTFLTGAKADIDLLRYKLGERSRRLSEHRTEVLLYNDRTGSWEKASAFADIGGLAMTVRSMDPAWRARREVEAGQQAARASMSTSSEVLAETPGSGLFIKACGACHSIGGGDRVGPDLAGVTMRRSRDWLLSYISEPRRIRAAGDPIAAELAMRFKAVRMPALGVSREDAGDLLAYIESREALAAASPQKPIP